MTTAGSLYYNGVLKVNEDHLDPSDAVGGFTVEASSLGWKPGFWPEVFYVGRDRFERVSSTSIAVDYYSPARGETIRVWND